MNTPRKRSGIRNAANRTLGKMGASQPAGRNAALKSGSNVKINRNLRERAKAKRDAKARARAEYLATLPKQRWQRILYRLHPKRVAKYWFSREGAIMALKITGVGLAFGFLLMLFVFAYFRKDLPNLKDVSGSELGGSVRYYDRTGQTLLWEDFDSFKRIPVKFEDISQYMKDATIAVEDKDFYSHNGFNVRGITRAAVNNITGSSGGTQGGSTITQQLVKITNDWNDDVTYTRKIKELILAVELERSFSKHEILTGYLNNAPYGAFETGVEAASQTYFGKSAKDLTIDEAAMFAAIPKSPTYLSVYNTETFEKESFIGRQHYVIDLMAEQGKISKEERDAAKQVDTLAKVKPRQPKYAGIKAPFFVRAAVDSLVDKFDQKVVKRGGWKVTTTLDLNLQNIAEEEYNKGIAQIQRQKGNTAAFVAEDVKTGQIVAMVGGTDFSKSEYNYATAELPPGSSVKPYDYAALIENGDKYGAGSVLYDTQAPLEGYPCTNKSLPPPRGQGNCLWDYDFRYPGPVTLRYALGGSRNVPAVKAMLIAGIDKTRDMMQRMGLKSGYHCYDPVEFNKGNKVESQCYASSAIGDGAYLRLDEHVHAYGTLSRNGKNIPQTYILKIEDDRGKVVSEWKQEEGEQAIKDETAYIISDMMADPNASYFSRKPHRYNGHKFALKTGTTNDAKDGWLMGFSSQYAAGVWVGHTDRTEMSGFMENMTQPIWENWMKRAHADKQPEDWPKPAGVQTLDAYIIRNHIGVGSVEPSPAKDLFPSWYKAPEKGNKTKRVIDTVSNKLATDCTPPRARKEVTDTDADAFSGDIFQNPGGNTQEKDDVHKCEDIKPTISLSVSKNGSTYRLSAAVSQGTHQLKTINFLISGQVLPGGSFEVSGPTTVTMDYTPDDSGTLTVVAEVIDVALYDASDSKEVSFEGSDEEDDDDFSVNPTRISATSARFSFSNYPGASSYQLCIDANPCVNYTKNSTITVTPGPHQARIKARSGGNDLATTGAVSF